MLNESTITTKSAFRCSAAERDWFIQVLRCFRAGIRAPLYSFYQIENLPPAGNGVPCAEPASLSVEQLEEQSQARNCELIDRLREDVHSQHLFEACKSDWELGRMTEPAPLDLTAAAHETFSPRFAVEQGEHSSRAPSVLRSPSTVFHVAGVRADGSIKVRPIDDMSASGSASEVYPFLAHVDRMFHFNRRQRCDWNRREAFL